MGQGVRGITAQQLEGSRLQLAQRLVADVVEKVEILAAGERVGVERGGKMARGFDANIA